MLPPLQTQHVRLTALMTRALTQVAESTLAPVEKVFSVSCDVVRVESRGRGRGPLVAVGVSETAGFHVAR